jgi:hypothetical protein
VSGGLGEAGVMRRPADRGRGPLGWAADLLAFGEGSGPAYILRTGPGRPAC